MVTVSYEATAAAIPGILRDIGINDERVYQATAQFAAQHLQECPGLEAGDLQDGCAYYAEGYRDALKGNG